MKATQTHEPSVEVSMRGTRVVCSCGWSTHRKLEESITPKKKALDRWYTEHYVPNARAAPG